MLSRERVSCCELVGARQTSCRATVFEEKSDYVRPLEKRVCRSVIGRSHCVVSLSLDISSARTSGGLI